MDNGIRTYVIVLFDRQKDERVSRQLRAYSAADAKVQAELRIQQSMMSHGDKWITIYELVAIEPFESPRHVSGELPWW